TELGPFPAQLDHLPNECLAKILANLSVQEQIQLRAVCTRWKGSIEAMLALRQSLKLIDSAQFYSNRLCYYYLEDFAHLKLRPLGHDDDLVVRQTRFDEQLSQFLPSILPNIRNLVLSTFDAGDL